MPPLIAAPSTLSGDPMLTASPLMRWFRWLLLPWCCLALAGTALAQAPTTDRGDYTILRASYGTAQHSVDVTERLKALAAQDQRFTLGNNTFGVDPDPGKVKLLRIEASGRTGQRRNFDYAEGSVVDGAQFSAWRQGQWGSSEQAGRWEQGERHGGWGNQGLQRVEGNGPAGNQTLQIVQATFGSPDRSSDVTASLQALASEGRNFQLVGTSFGVDPHPGVLKELTVLTRGSDGRLQNVNFSEGVMIDARQFSVTGAGPGMGGQNGIQDSGDYQILQARYGTPDRNIDVTERLRTLAAADQRFTMGNATFGNDPAPGQVKSLRIVARGSDGQLRNFDYREGSVVDGSQFTGWGAGQWGRSGWNGGWNQPMPAGSAGPLTILSATYGAGTRGVDVTARLQAQLRDNRLDVTVNNALAGTDPAPNQPKALWVSYRVGGGRAQQAQVAENARLSLP
jgi:hypothetical protein